MQLQMHGNETECGAMVHHLRKADPETDVRVCPIEFSEPITGTPDEWTLVATVSIELGVRCLNWATRTGCVCQIRNWPIYPR